MVHVHVQNRTSVRYCQCVLQCADYNVWSHWTDSDKWSDYRFEWHVYSTLQREPSVEDRRCTVRCIRIDDRRTYRSAVRVRSWALRMWRRRRRRLGRRAEASRRCLERSSAGRPSGTADARRRPARRSASRRRQPTRRSSCRAAPAADTWFARRVPAAPPSKSPRDSPRARVARFCRRRYICNVLLLY